jgi:predicted alpha/beta hydrolase family esterase
MKHQIIFIHGGDVYDTYEEYLEELKITVMDAERFERLRSKKWRDSLPEKLGEDFDVFWPSMPNNKNAKYLEWKIWLEKLLPFFSNEVILIGHSLGGIFLAKYLSENQYPKKIKALFLVAAPYDATGTDYKMADFILPEHLTKISNQVENIYLYHSKDDPVVPVTNLEKFHNELPLAKVTVFEDRQHFNQSDFPEIVEDIKSLF